ncbi:hypothetical protein DFH06DRAFT_1146984 [Mycena polygramma]|nr:hypothetical protein DFH06DRAFT_1146984 [Mycena polygramma]
MTDHGHLAPAAANTVVGAVIANIQQSLDVLSAAVDTLSGCASSLVATSMLDMGDAIGSVVAAADAVCCAQDDVDAAFKALGPLPSSAQAAPAPPPFVPAPTNMFIRSMGPWTAGLLYSVIPAAPLTTVPDNGGKWHAITRSKYIGLTQNSAVSLNAITGISTGLSQKFSNQADALNYFNAALATSALAVFKALLVMISGSRRTETRDWLSESPACFAHPPWTQPHPRYMPQTPPPVYTAVDDGQLHIRLASLNLDGVPVTSSRSPVRGTPQYSNISAIVSGAPPSPVLYTQSTPGTTVLATSWADAADETQGVSGASPRRVTAKRKKKKCSGAYAVFCGLEIGPFLDWADVQDLVIGVPNSVYQGYHNPELAHAAFEYAQEHGWTCVVSRSPRQLPTRLGPLLSDLPTPQRNPSNPLHGGRDGRCCATYDSWDDIDIAISKFAQAVAHGRLSFSHDRPAAQLHPNHRSSTPSSRQSHLAKSSIHRVAAFALDVTGVRHLHSEPFSPTLMSSTQLESPAPLTHFQVMQLKRAEERSKTRARMARFRRRVKDLPLEQQEPFKARARDAPARYKANHRSKPPSPDTMMTSIYCNFFPEHYAGTDIDPVLGTDMGPPREL